MARRLELIYGVTVLVSLFLVSMTSIVLAGSTDPAIDVWWEEESQVMTLTFYTAAGGYTGDPGKVKQAAMESYGGIAEWEGEWQTIQEKPTKVYQISQTLDVWTERVWIEPTEPFTVEWWSSTGWGEWNPSHSDNLELVREDETDLELSSSTNYTAKAGEWFTNVVAAANKGPAATTVYFSAEIENAQEVSLNAQTIFNHNCLLYKDRSPVLVECTHFLPAHRVVSYPIRMRGCSTITINSGLESIARTDIFTPNNTLQLAIDVEPYWADVNADGLVDVGDVVKVANAWRCQSGVDECYQERFDIDVDGTISIVDIMKFVNEWGWRCE